MRHVSEGFMKEVKLEFLLEGGQSRATWQKIRGKSALALEEVRSIMRPLMSVHVEQLGAVILPCNRKGNGFL